MAAQQEYKSVLSVLTQKEKKLLEQKRRRILRKIEDLSQDVAIVEAKIMKKTEKIKILRTRYAKAISDESGSDSDVPDSMDVR
jgi:hypothetical protein